MSSGKTILEESNGIIINNPTDDDIGTAIGKIGTSLEHCILETDGDISFIQAAGTKDRIFIQYSDRKSLFQSKKKDFTALEAADILNAAACGNTEWKDSQEFEVLSSFKDETTAASRMPLNDNGGSNKKSFKEQFLEAAKKEATSNISHIIKKGFRDLFSSRF